MPVLAALAGALLLGEALDLRFVPAAALVLGGVGFAVMVPSAPARVDPGGRSKARSGRMSG